MAAQMAILARTRTLVRTFNPVKTISTFSFLSQQPQLAESPPPPPPESAPLPPNPTSGNWRIQAAPEEAPLSFSEQKHAFQLHALAQTLDLQAVLDRFSNWMVEQKWSEMKEVFESWIRSGDRFGRQNKPDVGLYNLYLRANLMLGASAGELLDLMARMEEYGVVPNTASYNLVLRALCLANETKAAESLMDRMLEIGKESLPDEYSFALVIGMLFSSKQIDAALKYVDISLKSGHVLSMKVFNECVRRCLNKGRLDILVSIIERSQTMDQEGKALCPSWLTCKALAEAAMQEGNSKLGFYALKFMSKWITKGKNAQPSVHISIDEGLVVSALATAGKTYSSTLLSASWQVLQVSLLNKKAPNPETYIAKIYAYASLGSLKNAFHTLKEFEQTYPNTSEETEELFSPFTSLYPLAVACSKNGFGTLDSVYYELEKWSQANPPYKSVAALNCVIVGCANTWDLDRAYQTFEAIASFGLTPDIHSYNALIYAFGKLNKAVDATKVFKHFVSLGIKPNAKSHELLVDAHLMNRDPKAALSVIDEMVTAGFVPSKEALKKVRRRCVREMDNETDDQVEDLARKFQIRMGTEGRRNILFALKYDPDYV